MKIVKINNIINSNNNNNKFYNHKQIKNNNNNKTIKKSVEIHLVYTLKYAKYS